MHSFMNIQSFTRMDKSHQEFKHIKHSLRMAITNPTATIVEVKTIQDHTHDSNASTIYVWSEYSDIVNKLQNCKFEEGVAFPTRTCLHEANNYYYVQCALTFQNALMIKESDIMPLRANQLPEGFDCVCKVTSDSNESQKRNNYEYVIYDLAKVTPLKYVSFKIGEEESTRKCDNCTNNYSTVYCKQDEAYLCDNCNAEIHGKTEILRKHIRTPILDMSDTNGKCSKDGLEYNLWCHDCLKPLCYKCTLPNGQHSSDKHINHKVVELHALYEEAVKECSEEDVIVRSKKREILFEVEAVEKKIGLLNKKSKMIEEKIFDKVKELLSHLDTEVKIKMNFLSSNKSELNRRYEELEYWEKFQSSINKKKPLKYIKMWIMHNKAKDELIQKNVKLYYPLTEIKLEGEKAIRIISGNVKKDTITTTKPHEQEATHKTSILNSIIVDKQFASPTQANPDKYIKCQLYQFKPNAEPLAAHIIFDDVEGIIKSQMQVHSIEDSIKSMYGTYLLNYSKVNQLLKYNQQAALIANNAFNESKILTPFEKILLYFNLPLSEDCIPKTKKLYPSEGGASITVESFLKETQHTQLPIIIIFSIDNEIKFGGYASECWKPQSWKGDTSCFLFNISTTVRLNAVSGKPHYLYADSALCFGDSDLKINGSFNECSSTIEDYFINEATHNAETGNALMGSNWASPSEYEIWEIINI